MSAPQDSQKESLSDIITATVLVNGVFALSAFFTIWFMKAAAPKDAHEPILIAPIAVAVSIFFAILLHIAGEWITDYRTFRSKA